jgi:putative transcriptional regulator
MRGDLMALIPSVIHWRRHVLAIIAAIMAVSCIGAVAPDTSAPPGPAHESLAGQLLIAPPNMGDPRFDHAVILVVRHDRGGALGVVINMPSGERPLAGLLAAAGEPRTAASGNVPVFVGGPVQPNVALVVHSAEYQRPGTLAIDGRVAVTVGAQVLRDIAAHAGPQKSLVAFGYAGWAAGQLDGEMQRNVWFTAPADPKLVFDEDRTRVWDQALARRTRDL